ncbi:MAG: peptide ABC transporter substrate-binding protein [Bdellovibrionaceae bacterium]|nr:peptide ABC transporter substrate-binding protein [Pseudobdellovibrionaceae bacterium]
MQQNRTFIFYWVFINISLCSFSCTEKPQEKELTKIVVQQSEPVVSLDPALAQDLYSQRVIAQIFEPLVHYRKHSAEDRLHIEPLVAERWEISPDGKQYTFYLKKNIFFQNDRAFHGGKGREVRADDYIYSWKRIANPAGHSPNYWLIDNLFVGLRQWREGLLLGKSKFDDPIPGLTAMGPYTLKIILTEKRENFLDILTRAPLMAVAREVIEEGGNSDRPVGTGPFLFKEKVSDHHWRLTRNPKYSTIKTEKDTKHLFATLEFLYVADADTQRMLFEQGKMDVWNVPQQFDSLAYKNLQNKNGDYSLISFSNYSLIYIGFNSQQKFLKNVHLRKAMELAYDKNWVLEHIFGGRGTVADGILPPPLQLHNKGKALNQEATVSIVDAQKELAKGGFPSGQGLPEFTFDVPSTNRQARLNAEYFKEQMSKLNISIKISLLPWPQFIEKVRKRKSDIFMMSWIADIPDPLNFFDLFYSPNIPLGPDHTQFQSREYDRLYEKARGELDAKKRNELFAQMELLLGASTPAIFVLHPKGLLAVKNRYKNFQFDPIMMDTFH